MGTKNKKETKEYVNIRFNLGTKHFIDKHYSAPPKEDGTQTGQIATQIVGSVGKKWFVNGDTEAKAVRARNKINENKEKIGLTFSICKLRFRRHHQYADEGRPDKGFFATSVGDYPRLH